MPYYYEDCLTGLAVDSATAEHEVPGSISASRQVCEIPSSSPESQTVMGNINVLEEM